MRCVWAVAVLLAVPLAARADEAGDALAKKLGAQARDPRESLDARAEAARTIGKLGPSAAAAVPDLVAVLDRLRGAEQEPLQEAIVEALGQIGAPARGALPALARLGGRSVDIDQALKLSREQILTASDAADVEALVRQLGSRDASLRVRAAKALADLGPAGRAAVPTLVAGLGDTDADARRAIIQAIRVVQPNFRPTEALVRAIAVDLRDPDANYRLLAARMLGRIGPLAVAAAPDLDTLRNDPDQDVRRAALEALNRVTVVP